MRIAALVTILVPAALGACSLIVDANGLSGTSDAGGADAVVDVTPNDASGATGSDAALGADADGGFCERHTGAIFCEDFDNQAIDASAFWQQNGSAASAVVVGAPSPPAAFIAQVSALSQGQTGGATFMPPLLQTTAGFRCAFDVSVVSGVGPAVMDLRARAAGGDAYQAVLAGDSTGVVFEEIASRVDGGSNVAIQWIAPTPLKLDANWHHVEICFDFVSGTRVVAFDSQRLFSQTGLVPWPSPGTLNLGSILVGGPSASQEVHVDNVLVDTAACPP